jgi:wyosine [tRNA(Phe)-imidazoG37] synthetase (radical SAM superfamily)
MEPKVCSFNCIYCQLGNKGIVMDERGVFVKEEDAKQQLTSLMKKNPKADVVTFSGTGEPTLAMNLTDLAAVVARLTKTPIAILTNSSLFQNPGVREAMGLFDILIAKLDASNESTFYKVNRPNPSVSRMSWLASKR